jgi:pyruvate/2-oxoglutarate dehydrogenase complex dihydrolipoamide dehydrogenase (E3) component
MVTIPYPLPCEVVESEQYKYMTISKFDIFIIGGGSGGYAAARTAYSLGKKVAIADCAKELGGLCILRGCMPSKTLIYSAEILHSAQKGSIFGLNIESAKANMPAIHQRKLEVIEEFASFRREQLEDGRFTLFREAARFIDAGTIELLPSGKKIQADKFIIATGSVNQWPKIEGLTPENGIWTSDDILELDFVPESVIMLGGGVVACELAQFLNRIGSKVTQIQRSPHILKKFPQEASETLEKAFIGEGMEVITNTSLEKVKKIKGGYQVTFSKNGNTITKEASYVVNGLGRTPETSYLNLEKAGIELEPSHHIKTNAHQQTTNPDIYAVGDVTGPHEIVHVAIMQGELAANHAFEEKCAQVDYDNLTTVVFTDPQVATAGISMDECRKRGIEIISADYPFDDHGKSILMEAKYGYVKAWADKKSGIILGAECVGKDAGELIHTMAVAIALKAKAQDLLKAHWYHPTLSEIWTYPIEDIVDELNA